jgi:hypothetical protein
MSVSFLATCKLNNGDPVAYIVKTRQAILDGHPQSRIDEVMPWSFVTASTRLIPIGNPHCVFDREFAHSCLAAISSL